MLHFQTILTDEKCAIFTYLTLGTFNQLKAPHFYLLHFGGLLSVKSAPYLFVSIWVKNWRLAPVWSEESILCLQDCFHFSDWDLFKEVCVDLDKLTDIVSSYVSFCKSSIIPQKEILA